MKYLKKKHILAIHEEIEKEYGIESTILLPNNLESAIDAPQRNLFGSPVYSSVHEKAAALMRNLIKLHPFLDGNKRTALLATILFLDENGFDFQRDINNEVDVSVKTSQCFLEVENLHSWIKVKAKRSV